MYCLKNDSMTWCRGVKHEWAQRGGTHIMTQSKRTKVTLACNHATMHGVERCNTIDTEGSLYQGCGHD